MLSFKFIFFCQPYFIHLQILYIDGVGKIYFIPYFLVGNDGNRLFPCRKCGKKYTHYASMFKHMKYKCNMEPQFKCGICGKMLTLKANLKKHMLMIHNIDPTGYGFI